MFCFILSKFLSEQNVCGSLMSSNEEYLGDFLGNENNRWEGFDIEEPDDNENEESVNEKHRYTKYPIK